MLQLTVETLVALSGRVPFDFSLAHLSEVLAISFQSIHHVSRISCFCSVMPSSIECHVFAMSSALELLSLMASTSKVFLNTDIAFVWSLLGWHVFVIVAMRGFEFCMFLLCLPAEDTKRIKWILAGETRTRDLCFASEGHFNARKPGKSSFLAWS